MASCLVFLLRPLFSLRFLPPPPFDLRISLGPSTHQPFDPFHEFAPCEKSIEALTSLPHALHLDSRREVAKVDTARCFVHLLTARSGGANESLLEILLTNPQRLHLFPKETALLFAHRKRNHDFFPKSLLVKNRPFRPLEQKSDAPPEGTIEIL